VPPSPTQLDGAGVAQRFLALCLQYGALSVVLSERYHATRPNIELPPRREGLIALPCPCVPEASGAS